MANANPVHKKGQRKRSQPPKGVATAAIVTLHKPGAMTDQGRRDIAQWLRKTATEFLKYGAEYNDTGRFIARYVYDPKVG